MAENNLDAWVVICRENNNDPLADHVGCENAGGTAAYMFFREDDSVTSVASSPRGEATSLAETGRMDEVITSERGASIWNTMADVFERFGPLTIGINTGRSPITDGLTHTQYTSMMDGLPSKWTSRMTSSEAMIRSWLSVKTPTEVEIMALAAEITAQWEGGSVRQRRWRRNHRPRHSRLS